MPEPELANNADCLTLTQLERDAVNGLDRADGSAQQAAPDRKMHPHVLRLDDDRRKRITLRRHSLRLGSEQRLRIGMLRRFEDFLDAARLDNLAALHHRDIVCELANDVEIVGDEQHRHVVAILQILEQCEDLRLHGDIERRRRLVGDEEIRSVGEAHRNHHALTLTPRKLVGIGRKPLRRIWDADLRQQFNDPLRQRGPLARAMKLENFADLPRDRVQWVQRGHRLLKHHRDRIAADSAQSFLIAFQNILALEQRGAGDMRAGREQPQDRQRRDRLPGAGFADDRQRATARQRKRYASDRGKFGAALPEGHAQIAHIEKRCLAHAIVFRGSKASRTASPMKINSESMMAMTKKPVRPSQGA